MNKKLENILLITSIAVIVWLAGFMTWTFADHAEKTDKELLLDWYKAQLAIKSDQVLEAMHQHNTIRAEVYNQGYEAGKIYMGMAQLQGKGMVSYADGYHAAISQFHSDSMKYDHVKAQPQDE